MSKYIDAEKLIAEIERRKKQDTTIRERSILIDIETAITSLQQEQPMPDSTKLIEFWNEDKEMLKEKDFRDDAWRLAYNAFMCGFGRGISVKKQEQPEGDLDREIIKYKVPFTDDKEYLNETTLDAIAHHFYELGHRTKYQQDREEFAKLKAKEWQSGYDEGYAKGLNARKEE